MEIGFYTRQWMFNGYCVNNFCKNQPEGLATQEDDVMIVRTYEYLNRKAADEVLYLVQMIGKKLFFDLSFKMV